MDEIDMKRIAEDAVETSKQFDGLKLDYSLDSLNDLEDMIQYFRDLNRKGKLSETGAWDLAVMSGAYMGEVLLRGELGERGYSWQMNNNGLPVVMDQTHRNAISPLSKIHKKLLNTQEGSDEEGTVMAYYQTFLLLLTQYPSK